MRAEPSSYIINNFRQPCFSATGLKTMRNQPLFVINIVRDVLISTHSKDVKNCVKKKVESNSGC